MHIKFDTPRRWVIRIYGPMDTEGIRYRRHQSLGILAMSAEDAIKKTSSLFPTWRLESCADTGGVDYVLVDRND